MLIYLDNDYRCHLTNDGTMREIDTDAFDGKCKMFIEGFRYIPEGETWRRPDGVEFPGLMVAPSVDYSALHKVQEQYEEDFAQMTDMQNALDILGVSP